MKPEEVFKRYDIRGEYPEEINEEFAERLGKALGTFALRNYSNMVVVGKDNKESSGQLKKSLIQGLESTGVNVLDAGTGPTDFVAFNGSRNDCISVQVTSSHLPLDTNGFKFMYPGGNGFVNEDLYQVQDLFRDQDFESGNGNVSDISREAEEEYRRKIKDFFHGFSGSIDRKIVVETMGGATTRFLPGLLEDLGADVINLAEGEDSPYIDPPEPSPERLEHVEEHVENEDADLALANDMDADRIAVYYDGRWLTGDEIFALLADLTSGDIVGSIDTSLMVEDFLRSQGREIHYTRIGDPFVMDEALKREVKLAGEPNGHYSFLDFVAYNSGTLAGLMIAGTNIDLLLEQLPEYHTEKVSIELENKHEVMEDLEEYVRENHTVSSTVDGIEFRIGDTLVLARPSGSSPKIRVKADSRTREKAEEAVDEIEEFIRNQ